MPTPSANPIRLQVIDRIVTVLSAITAGADYWFTPGKVTKGFLLVNDIPAFPWYGVMAAEKGGLIDPTGMPNHHDEDITISIKGVIKCSSQADAVTMTEKALRDIRKAIWTDAISGAAGSLGVIAVKSWFIEGPDMDDGYLIQGFGFFDQRLAVQITGEFGEL